MLVLTRKKGEAVIIGNNIKISIIDIDSDKISIGIDAPKEVKIIREELVNQTISYNIESLMQKSEILKQFERLKETNL